MLAAATTTTVQLTAVSTVVQLWLTTMTDSYSSSSNNVKSQNFLFQLKIKTQLRKSFTFPKNFSYLLIIPSNKSHLVTYLALYKEDQAITTQDTHGPTTHLSHTLLFWNIIHFAAIYTFPYFSISLTKFLFLDNTYYTPLSISPTLYYSKISSSCCPYL